MSNALKQSQVAPSSPGTSAVPAGRAADPEQVARWLAEITGRPLAEVCQLLLSECQLVGNNVRRSAMEFGLEPHIWNDRLLEFYASTDSFLFETAAWNACPMKITMRQFVCDAVAARLPAGSKVLCFGDGMGFDSAAIADRGMQVTCFEVSGPCLDFARRLFAAGGRNVRISTDTAEFQPGSFDAIVCLDVLEHVPDPPAVVRSFAQWLRADGLLLAHAPFYHVDSTRPTHLASNKQYAGAIASLYGQAGFRHLDVGGWLLDPLVFQKSAAETAPAVSGGVAIRRAVGRGLAIGARLLPFVPGMVASVVARPERWWTERLRDFARRNA